MQNSSEQQPSTKPETHTAVNKVERKAFVLLSGGLDSTTCLFKAILDYKPQGLHEHLVRDRIEDCKLEKPFDIDWVEAVSINYGQRHIKEADYAKKTCDRLGIKHTILDVGALLRGDTVMLTNDSRGKVDVPNISYSDIRGVSPTYVPFRNGLMLSALTAHAQKWVSSRNEFLKTVWRNQHGSLDDWSSEIAQQNVQAGIYFGAHSEDAANWAYPDCTPEFIAGMSTAIFIGTYMQIRLHTPLQWLMKSEIVELGTTLGVRFEDTWSCYKGEELHCGVCPTCRSRRDAFDIAREVDPTDYQNDAVAKMD